MTDCSEHNVPTLPIIHLSLACTVSVRTELCRDNFTVVVHRQKRIYRPIDHPRLAGSAKPSSSVESVGDDDTTVEQ